MVNKILRFCFVFGHLLHRYIVSIKEQYRGIKKLMENLRHMQSRGNSIMNLGIPLYYMTSLVTYTFALNPLIILKQVQENTSFNL